MESKRISFFRDMGMVCALLASHEVRTCLPSRGGRESARARKSVLLCAATILAPFFARFVPSLVSRDTEARRDECTNRVALLEGERRGAHGRRHEGPPHPPGA